MSSPPDLTTLANAKQWLAITTTVSDPLLSRLITASSLSILNFITRDIFSTAYTEVRNGMGGYAMMTKQFPITAVAGVTVNGIVLSPRAPLTQSSTSTGGNGTYVFDDTRIYVNGGCGFPVGQQNVTLQYTAGYTSVPGDLEQACIDVIGDWFRYQGRIGKLSEDIGGQSVSFLTAQMRPIRAQGIINTYNSVSPVY